MTYNDGAEVSKGSLCSASNTAISGGVWLTPPPPAALPSGKIPCSDCIGCWVGNCVRSERVRKFLLPPEFDPQALQHIASRHTDCAVSAHNSLCQYSFYCRLFQHYNRIKPKGAEKNA